MNPNNFLELIIMAALFAVGLVAHIIATWNKGSFVDMPDWNKVVRRAIELICTLIAVVLLTGLGWGHYWLASLFLIAFPTLGIVFCVLVYVFQKKKIKAEEEKVAAASTNPQNPLQQMILSLHLVNALTLVLFLLSGLLVILITIAKTNGQPGNVVFLYSVLSLVLSSELLLLAYQLCSLILVHRVPNEENIKIVKICNELNN